MALGQHRREYPPNVIIPEWSFLEGNYTTTSQKGCIFIQRPGGVANFLSRYIAPRHQEE